MKRIATILLLSLVILPLQAEDIKIHGFVAQGLIQAQDSNFVNDDGDVSLKLTEVGVNASYKINSQLRVAGQGVYLNGGNRYPEGLRIDYLFLDWHLVSNADWQFKLQLGRNKNYHWLYSSTRDVPHTRPSIILPQSLYFDAFRDVALGVDGLTVIVNTQNYLGDWDFNLSVGTSPISEEQTANLLGDLASGELEHKKDQQFSVYWRPVKSQWQLGMSLLDADFSYAAGENDVLFNGKETSQRIALHILYQGERWEFVSELLRERVILSNFVYPGFNSDKTSEGGYVQARYFLNPKFNLMARLDIYDQDRKDRKGLGITAMSQGLVPAYFGYMDQATLGLSWKIAKNMQLQGEYHRVKGAGRLAPFLVPDVINNNHLYWDMWALQLMYWF